MTSSGGARKRKILTFDSCIRMVFDDLKLLCTAELML